MSERYYTVNVPAHCSFTVYVKAESEKEALAKASGFEGMTVGICHQCSSVIDEVNVGSLSETAEAYECVSAHEIDRAEDFIDSYGDGE